MSEKKPSFFSRLFGKDTTACEMLGSPMDGELMALEAVADPVFSGKILGDGVAIRPAVGQVLSPVDGEVSTLPDTGHAVGITSPLGAELLIHVGRDTVTLKGEHFSPKVKEGDKVKRGQLLLEFDREALLEKGFDLDTPVIVTNSDEFDLAPAPQGPVQGGQTVLTLTKKEG